VAAGIVRPLEAGRHPTAVELAVRPMSADVAAVERELRTRAGSDRDRCFGYFPGLNGASGIASDLPACRAFARRLPELVVRGAPFRFNFLRLSLVQQSARAAYHLDSDVATAITGDVATISQRHILRLLLNLSARSERTLHYLNVDPGSVELIVEGCYIRVADPDAFRPHSLVARIPPRRGSRVHGLVFASNRVLHSGVDDELGHFVAAYGAEEDASGSSQRG
jgi:hypothetical protein